jgi:hypothetical protein
VLYIFGYIHAWFIIPVFLYLWIFYFNNKFIGGIYDKSLELEENAGKFITVFEFLEKYNYARNIHLKKLCNSFIINRPSESFRRIKRIILAMGFTQNPFYFLLLNIIFPWNYWFALKFEYLKKDIYVSINDWLETWYSLEVLVSFAFIKYLNPNYTFPLVRGTATDTILNMNEAAIGNNGIANLPVLRAVNLSHPLIPYDKNVSNSFTLHDIGETIIITGSNMSGKSTFLKTIGTNMALAYAGAPVAASVMELGSFRLFTCIKINDSVTDGISYFYAEVKRLKGLLDEIKEENSLPLFYLIDEIFRGTNNYERLIGSRSYIKTLTGLKGCGIISTHDLELVKLEQEINQIHNYHFREEAEGGKMIFDYKLRTGPCPTTNALKIMMNEGLPVII